MPFVNTKTIQWCELFLFAKILKQKTISSSLKTEKKNILGWASESAKEEDAVSGVVPDEDMNG